MIDWGRAHGACPPHTDNAVRVNAPDGNPLGSSHGTGALGMWSITLVDHGGAAHTHYADLTARIDTLPVYGTLYAVRIARARDGGSVCLRACVFVCVCELLSV